MTGPVERLIRRRGVEHTVRNASGGGGRSTPTYADDGTVIGVLEQRGMPQRVTDSSGEDVETDVEIRTINTDGVEIRGAGHAEGYPTKLVHPSGRTYRVLDDLPEDSGVTVLTVVRD